jgi:hypothetical protein
VRKLPSLSIEVTTVEDSSSTTPPQTASGSSKPVDDDDLQYAAFKADRVLLANTM